MVRKIIDFIEEYDILKVAWSPLMILSYTIAIFNYPSLEVGYLFLTKSQIASGVLCGTILVLITNLIVPNDIKSKNLHIIGLVTSFICGYIILSSFSIQVLLGAHSEFNEIDIIKEKTYICGIEDYVEEPIPIEELNEMRYMELGGYTINTIEDATILTKHLPLFKAPHIIEYREVSKPPKKGTVVRKLFDYYYADEVKKRNGIIEELDTTKIIFYVPGGDIDGFVF